MSEPSNNNSNDENNNYSNQENEVVNYSQNEESKNQEYSSNNEEENKNNESNEENDSNVNDLNSNNNNDIERVENESLYSYDENKDFPVFANKINKRLNDIILNYKKELKNLVKEIEEDKEMVKILKDHTASVENQVKNREKMQIIKATQ